MRADVVVIGGGLAGAAFALQLAREGARVAVLERTRAPHLKVCGDFLSADALDQLASLGIEPRAAGAMGVITLKLHVGGRATAAALPFRAAGLARLRLDEALLAAAGQAGAEVVRGATVTGLEPQGASVIVRAGDCAWQARTVALATGKRNLIDAGFKREVPRRLGSVAVAAYPPLAALLARLTRLRPEAAAA
jgi:flavin-dependent dehydrogenase